MGSDKFFNFDCDTSSFIYLAIAEKLEIPLYFIEVKNFGEALNHNFVRWDLGGGVWIDWDTNDRRVREVSKPQGIYGTSYTPKMLHSYLIFLQGLEWKRQNKLSKEIAAYRVAMMIDAGLPHAANNMAWAFVENLQAQKFVSAKEALKCAEFAVQTDRDPNFLDTLAAVHAELGDFDRAVLIQEEVVREKPTDEFKKRLEGYKKRLTYLQQQ